MAKSKVANSGSRDQTPQEVESSYEKLKMEEEPRSDRQGGDHVARRFSFMAAIYNYIALSGVKSGCISSKISCGALMSLQSKNDNHMTLMYL